VVEGKPMGGDGDPCALGESLAIFDDAMQRLVSR
jgi:hypothetical protein